MNRARLAMFPIVVGLCCSSMMVAAAPDSDARVGRYARVTPLATPSQSDLLSVLVNITFDTHLSTVGESFTHLLARSGYQLADLEAADPYLPILLSRPLPQAHRQLGPIRLDHALTTLAGPAWRLVVDPVNRLISFELLPQYRSADGSADNMTSLGGQ